MQYPHTHGTQVQFYTLSQDVHDDFTLRLGEEAMVEVILGLSQKAVSLKVGLKRMSNLQDQVFARL